MDKYPWGTSLEGQEEAARAARERLREFRQEMDRVIERELGIPPASERKGVSLEKDETTRQMFTSRPSQQAMRKAAPEKQAPTREAPAYDSPERRKALALHLERQGVPRKLIESRLLVELGQARPPTAAMETPDRRDPNSKGAAMRAREREAREREGRERDR